MTQTSSEEQFQKTAEAEGGMPISAGARVAHVRAAVKSGRAFSVDLSAVPEDKRPSVLAELAELVNRASAHSLRKAPPPAPDEPNGQG